MRLSSAVAIFFLFWALSFFFVLPFRLRSSAADEAVAGQMPGAPPPFSFWRTAKWTTVVAVVLFGLFYLNYRYQWVPVSAFDLVPDKVLEGQ
jgi:predicted secreted protein